MALAPRGEAIERLDDVARQLPLVQREVADDLLQIAVRRLHQLM